MKSKTTAYLLWFFLGVFSAHRFYMGKTGSAIVYLLTGQLLGIGWIVDLFLLGGMVDQYNTNEELKTIRTATMANTTAHANNTAAKSAADAVDNSSVADTDD